MNETRTILLLGRTGGGKSTLANVLINQNDNFEEVFREGAGTTSATRQNQAREFEVNLTEDGAERVKYVIVDTVGLCDTKMTDKGVLHKIAEMSNQIGDGLNQILFVTGGRFTREEMKAYNILSQILFDSQVVNYTTIVRTNFPAFEDEEACEQDRQALRGETLELFNILRDARIIYVDNPPVNISGSGRRIERQISLNKEIREESRTRLLTHLAACQEVYKPNNLATLNQRVDNYQTEEEKMQAQVDTLQQRMASQAASYQAQINDLKTKHQQNMKDLESKMKQDLRDELDKKEKKIKEINDAAQSKQDELQKKLDELNKQVTSSSAVESVRWEIARINQETSQQLTKIEEEKKANKEEQDRILELEKRMIGMQVWAYGQEVRNQERERYDSQLAEIKQELGEIKQKAEEPKTVVNQIGLANIIAGRDANASLHVPLTKH